MQQYTQHIPQPTHSPHTIQNSSTSSRRRGPFPRRLYHLWLYRSLQGEEERGKEEGMRKRDGVGMRKGEAEKREEREYCIYT